MLTEGQGEAMGKEIRYESSPINSLTKDLIMDIVLRLPVKSLLRFKCVSKSCFALITDPYFVKLHLNQCRKRLVLPLSDSSSSSWTKLVVFSYNSIDEPSEIHFDSLFQYPAESVRFWGSCDGLLLCSSPSLTLHLVNPSTREFSRLPDSPIQSGPKDSYGFGYDASTDDYKVVHISYSFGRKTYMTTSLYTLKTNSWRRIEDIPYKVTECEPATLVNGSLHWVTENKRKIVSFNLAEEKFQDFLFRNSKTQFEAYLFTVRRGCLRESWTNLGLNIPYPYHGVKPLDYSTKDKILFLIHGRLLVSNLEKDRHRCTKIHYDTQLCNLQFGEAETFLESIVSPGHHTSHLAEVQ